VGIMPKVEQRRRWWLWILLVETLEREYWASVRIVCAVDPKNCR
jgi:hypothetical protein